MGELRPQKTRGCEELNKGVRVDTMRVASPRCQKSLSEQQGAEELGVPYT